MIAGSNVLDRVVDGRGYRIREISVGEYSSIYEYSILDKNEILKKECRINIIDAIKTAEQLCHAE